MAWYRDSFNSTSNKICGNAENGCMSPVTCMGYFVIHVEGTRRGKITRKRERNSEEACCGIAATPRGVLPQKQSFLCFALLITFI
jgi:hypothetical protein